MSAGRKGDGMDRSSQNLIETLARLGYAARGAVFVIIGGLAALAAWGSGGRATDSRGALQTVLEQPFGRILLGVIALGLAGFALWRAIQALLDADGCGTDWKGLARRAARGVGAVTYGALAVSAVTLALGQGGGGESSSTQDWTAWLMAQPAGRWLVAGVGLLVVGAGAATALKGWNTKFERHLSLDDDTRRWAVPMGRAGFIAHGVVLSLIGVFLLLAAWRARSQDAEGVAGALRAIQEQRYGWILLGIVALGLVAFGVFNFVQARYRRIDAPRPGDAAGHVRDIHDAVRR
jgi:hypothetical protein